MLEAPERALLEEAVELGHENQKLIRKLVRAQRWGHFLTIVKLILIVTLAGGLYYYLQPFIDNLLEAYQSVAESIPKAGQFLETPFR
jgi:hypothetical protein